MSRHSIPAQTQRELWARSAGRCEFRGCNELLYRDNLTQDRSNLATIAHIVACSEKGPRGDADRSPRLATAISNLMLTCKKHGDMIDDLSLVTEYPESLLLTFKREHEDRIRIATGVQQEAQTHVLLIQGPVGSNASRLDETKAHTAIRPKYPAQEHPYVIDLASLNVPASHVGFYGAALPSVKGHLRTLLHTQQGAPPIRMLSIFAIAPIPLLIHVGHIIGDIQPVELYQCHRNHQYAWPIDQEEANAFYEIALPGESEILRNAPVALILSISGKVNPSLVVCESVSDVKPIVYSISAANNKEGYDFLSSRMRLQLFGYELRRVLGEIRRQHGHKTPVHVFAAIPAPIAIELGRSLRHVDPPFHLYDFQDGKYVHKITVND